jgi:carbonic anhydrase
MEHHNETDLNLAVEFNVHEQSRRILERSQLIRKAVEAGQTRLVSAIYEVETGLVRVI